MTDKDYDFLSPILQRAYDHFIKLYDEGRDQKALLFYADEDTEDAVTSYCLVDRNDNWDLVVLFTDTDDYHLYQVGESELAVFIQLLYHSLTYFDDCDADVFQVTYGHLQSGHAVEDDPPLNKFPELAEIIKDFHKQYLHNTLIFAHLCVTDSSS